jgi:endoglucanase
LGLNIIKPCEAVVAPKNNLGRGINLGGTMEAFEGGEEGGLTGDEAASYHWAYPLKAEYFTTIKNAGFKHIRLPISWPTNKPGSRYSTLTVPPYTINPDLFQRVDWVIAQALKNGLAIILDNHDINDPLHTNLEAEQQRFLAIWQQIAERYKSQPNNVYFELLNEPGEAILKNPVQWNNILNMAIATIRQTNPTRPIIISGGSGSPWTLPLLQLPANDRNLIVTFHFYEPYTFTSQGMTWPEPRWPVGVAWTGKKPSFIASQDGGMQMGSWFESTTWTFNPSNTLKINYSGWGGIYFGFYYQGLAGFNSLSFKTNRAGLRLSVLCNEPDTGSPDNPYYINTLSGTRAHTIKFSDCGGTTNLNTLRIANDTNLPVSNVSLQNLELKGSLGKLPLVTTELGQIQATFDYVATWAKLNNRSVYLGEFGTYADSEWVDNGKSRALWAKTVRQEAEKRGFSWGYWDFGSGGECGQQKGYGIYTRAINRPDCVETAKWNTRVLNTLK